MDGARSERDVLDAIRNWAERRADVRTVLLTGSRAYPDHRPDILSDYDLEVFVTDVLPYVSDDDWVRELGQVMVRWPSSPGPTFDEDWVTQLVLYNDGVRIDFQITALPPGSGESLDDGYRVLVDKDGAARRLSRPTFRRHSARMPSHEELTTLLETFWWDIVYVAKALHRREWNAARHAMEVTVRFELLVPLLEAYACRRHGSIRSGPHGRRLHPFLEPELGELYDRTFPGAGVENGWRAMWAAVELVRRVARELTDAVGCRYPVEVDREVSAYLRWIEELSSS